MWENALGDSVWSLKCHSDHLLMLEPEGGDLGDPGTDAHVLSRRTQPRGALRPPAASSQSCAVLSPPWASLAADRRRCTQGTQSCLSQGNCRCGSRVHAVTGTADYPPGEFSWPFALCSGQRPWSRTTTRATPLAELFRATVRSDSTPSAWFLGWKRQRGLAQRWTPCQ